MCERLKDDYVLKKFQEATADSTPCDLFDDLSTITIVMNRITVWITNQLKGHFIHKGDKNYEVRNR